MTETPLCELARKYGTDKGGEHRHYNPRLTSHRYTPVYYDLFKDRREEPLKILEIGVQFGQSMNMWLEFFPNATVYGWDISMAQFTGPIDPRLKLMEVDQTKSLAMLTAIELIGCPLFDLIVDDGTHYAADQAYSFKILLPYLHPAGSYCIEDKGGHLPYALVVPPPTYELRIYDQRLPCSILQVIRYVGPAISAWPEGGHDALIENPPHVEAV